MPIEIEEPYLLFIKMVQSVQEVLHHKKDLDLTHVVLEIRNTNRDKYTQKRLYFNKEIYSIGYVPCTVKDNIKLTFSTKQDDSFISFA
jgi:hypothetical protein